MEKGAIYRKKNSFLGRKELYFIQKSPLVNSKHMYWYNQTFLFP